MNNGINVLITGGSGFLGKNLIDRLSKVENVQNFIVKSCNSQTSFDEIKDFSKKCNKFVNLAAVHRPENKDDFYKINCDYFSKILECMEIQKNHCQILYSSSIQALDESDYGRSKLRGENILSDFVERQGTRGIVYRLTNTFGRWAKPNAHSVVATFCYNISRGLPIIVSDPKKIMHLCYVDDVVDLLMDFILKGCSEKFSVNYVEQDKITDISLENLADQIYGFQEAFLSGKKLYFDNKFSENLYNTFMSYKAK